LSKFITVFLNLFVESKELSKITDVPVKLPEVADAYEVTSEYDVVSTLHVEKIQVFRELLKDKILKIEGSRVMSPQSFFMHTSTKTLTPLSSGRLQSSLSDWGKKS